MRELRVSEELAGANFGDRRLNRRVGEMTEAFSRNASASIPVAMGTTAGREASYRFLSNRRVTLGKVLEPHREATIERVRQAGKAYLISDTTEFKFSTERDGLGIVSAPTRNGFLGHFTMAVSADGRRVPLGILGIETWTRSAKKGKRNHFQRKEDPERESLRWGRCAITASQGLQRAEAVHVMDREADIYELLSQLIDGGHRFIIRSAQNRSTDEGRLFSELEAAPARFTREVKLSKRIGAKEPESRKAHPARRGRLATLTFATKQVTLLKATSATEPSLPESVTVNVVRVWEIDPPTGQDPVEWRLYTTEPINSQDQVETVVDGYRTRWLIEEYFKALKTGCSYEKAQLESLPALLNLLGIHAAIAWQLLVLRSTARNDSDRPATEVLSTAQLAILRILKHDAPLPPNPTVRHALLAVAALGAHIKNNGEPGWQVLGRGFMRLLDAAELYAHLNPPPPGTCDQS